MSSRTPRTAFAASAEVAESAPLDGPSPAAIARRRAVARWSAWTAVALYAAQFAVGAAAVVSGGDAADHATGLGGASEALGGLAFLAGAVVLGALAPRGARLAAWVPGIAGLAASGLTMAWVVGTRVEPPVEVFLAEVALMALGLLVAGVLGALRRRVWPWWVGTALALVVPVMFLVPVNSLPLALAWAAVALTARPDPRS
ncbi:hypothetical protein GCM10009819_36960 [Agromyces tropicus]|uniref:Uncharacterized protein n=1 Tax=Agromyces tropicus TaxID=555371 RepID=A0ABP5GKC7_9MICO